MVLADSLTDDDIEATVIFDEESENGHTVTLNNDTVRNARAYWLQRFEADFASMTLQGVRDPVIVMLLNDPADLAAQGLDPYMFEEVSGTSNR